MSCASDSERKVSEQVGKWAISMMVDSCFDGKRQFVQTAVVAFSSQRGGRRCRHIAAVRGRCRRGVVSPPSDRPHSALDKVNRNILVQTRLPKIFWSCLVGEKKMTES